MFQDARLPDYDDPALAQCVESLTETEINHLPFGAIRVGADGLITHYSEAERRLSGSGPRPRLGLRFFDEIAPCMNKEAYRGRIERALSRGALDLEFTHVGDFDDRTRELTVRVQPAAGGGYWIFMRRDG